MAVLLLMPTALAVEGSGRFVVDGVLEFPPQARVAGAPLAFFTNHSQGLTSLHLQAPTAHLYVVEERLKAVEIEGVTRYSHAEPVRVVEKDLRNAELELVDPGSSAGWLGIYSTPSSAKLEFVAKAAPQVEVTGISTVGHGERTLGPAVGLSDPGPRPMDKYYSQALTREHFILESTGDSTLKGAATLKLLGPRVRITSEGYSTEVDTGFVRGSGTVHDDVYRWIVLSFGDGVFQMTMSEPVQIALQSATMTWSGAAAFRVLQGQFDSTEATYSSTGARAMLDGAFVASILPRREGERLLTSMYVEGDLASTTLQPQGILVSPARGAPADLPWLSLFLFGAVVVAGSAGATVLVTRRRRAVAAQAEPAHGLVGPYDGLHADDFMRLADEAAVERRWARALQWVQRARDLAPANARIRADEGEYLFQLGLFEEALQAFAEASRLDGEEGYADYRGAQAAAAAGRPVDEVLAWLERALARSPDLVGDLELFKEFDTMRGLPAYDVMVREAYARLGIDPAFP